MRSHYNTRRQIGTGPVQAVFPGPLQALHGNVFPEATIPSAELIIYARGALQTWLSDFLSACLRRKYQINVKSALVVLNKPT